jgi:YtcA-like protein
MHCPSLNIFGTFFPSWMLSVLIGLIGGIVAYKVFSLPRIKARVTPEPLVYPSIILTITFIVWLCWYGQ